MIKLLKLFNFSIERFIWMAPKNYFFYSVDFVYISYWIPLIDESILISSSINRISFQMLFIDIVISECILLWDRINFNCTVFVADDSINKWGGPWKILFRMLMMYQIWILSNILLNCESELKSKSDFEWTTIKIFYFHFFFLWTRQ